MRIDRLTRPAVVLAVLICAAPAAAQPQNLPPYPTPRLTIISPTGGKPGATFEMTLTGADVDGAIDLVFSHPGFKADLIEGPTDAGSPTTPQRPRNPQGMAAANATAKFKVTVPADAPPGVHDVRVLSKWGVTNPRAFVVSSLDDVLEKEPNSDVSEAQKVALETAVTGNVGSPTDVDYYAFTGSKGQRVVAACAAWGVDSRLTAQVQLYDAAGRELAANRNYRDRDAVVDAVLPDDGEYRVRVSEFAHLVGGPEYFYRLTITTAPWIDAAYPPVVPPGKEAVVTLFGRNLPGGKPDPRATLDGRPLERLELRITAPAGTTGLDFRDVLPASAASLEGFEYRLRAASGTSNPVLIGLARAPVILDNEDNDTPEKAQSIPVPSEVCGRTEKRGDRDRYVFTAKQGDVLLIDGQCERLGYPADLYLQVVRADTRAIVAEIDDPQPTDIPPSLGRLYTRTDDPRGRVSIPADGRYELVVASRTIDVKADPRSVYRVTVEREAPDFQVVLTGSGDIGAGGCTMQLGGSRELMVACFRAGSFNGEITLEAEGLPAGLTCAPQVIGPNQRQGWLVLTSAADGRATVGTFRVKATAMVNGEKVVREARAGCLVWPLLPPQNQQPNVPAISRLCRSLAVAVTAPGPFSLKTPDREVAVPVGGTVSVKVEVERQGDFKGPIQLVRLNEQGQGGQGGRQGQMQPVTIAAGQSSGEVKFQLPNNTPPGSFNLVLLGSSQISFSKDPKGNKVNVNYVAAVPSVRVTVTAGVVDLAPAARSVAVKPGGQAPLAVKLTRLGNYRGEVKLTLVPPQGFQGLRAEPVTVAAGQTEGKLILTADAKARQATSSNVIVRATATVGGATITQDARITVAVSNDAETVFAGETSSKTLIAASGDGWKFAAAEKVKGDGWRRMEFDDKGWKAGKAPIGYGEEEIANRKGTTITEQGTTVLFRRVIDIPAEMLEKKGTSFRLLVASDDSAEVYVNGDLVDTDPEADHEYKYWNREVDLGAKVFKPGKNVIAVKVLNKDGSSDLFLDLELSALMPVVPKK